MPVWVKDEFINAWKQEWKPSMLLGLLLGVLWSVLAYRAYMVVAVDGGMSVGYLLMMLLAAYFLTGLTLFGYQQIAMLELPFGTQLKKRGASDFRRETARLLCHRGVGRNTSGSRDLLRSGGVHIAGGLGGHQGHDGECHFSRRCFPDCF